ncbi:MAG TPA: phage terminase small subunit P27 family, partial [Pirellulales bacterium]|nr:phage terminase small subunit P27 family [Pirellulales bacterium]
LGLLTRIDRGTLAAYCVVYGRWTEAETKIKVDGLVVKVNGQIIPNPYLSVANAALKQMREFASEFGMTPSARTRVKAMTTAGKDKAKSKWANVLPMKRA